MKFVIILLAFLIPLLTSTGALRCYDCFPSASYPPEYCHNATGVPGKECEEYEKYCVTWFDRGGGRVRYRHCFDPNPNNKDIDKSSQLGATSYVETTGCQALKPKDGSSIKFHICLCKTDDCNNDAKSSLHKNNTGKMVGMSLATLLGGVLALSLMKYL